MALAAAPAGARCSSAARRATPASRSWSPGCAGCWPGGAWRWRRSRRRTWRSTPRSPPTAPRSATPSGSRRWRPGCAPEAAMNPVLLKPTGERASQVVVMGRATGVQTAAEYHAVQARRCCRWCSTPSPTCGRRFDVVICEGAGSPAEINLLDGDIVNLPLARRGGAAGDRRGRHRPGRGVRLAVRHGGRSCPTTCGRCVRGFVVNKLRGDPALLGDACADLERRCGVPTLGVVPMAPSATSPTSTTRTRSPSTGRTPSRPARPTPATSSTCSTSPRCAGPGCPTPATSTRCASKPGCGCGGCGRSPSWAGPTWSSCPGRRTPGATWPGSTRTGLAAAVERSDAAVVAVCAGLQMVGGRIDDPDGVEGPPGGGQGPGLAAR